MFTFLLILDLSKYTQCDHAKIDESRIKGIVEII